jgi:hypothetical protein
MVPFNFDLLDGRHSISKCTIVTGMKKKCSHMMHCNIYLPLSGLLNRVEYEM